MSGGLCIRPEWTGFRRTKASSIRANAMSQKYPYNVNVPLSPHPAFGHPPHEPRSRRRESAHLFAFEAKD